MRVYFMIIKYLAIFFSKKFFFFLQVLINQLIMIFVKKRIINIKFRIWSKSDIKIFKNSI